MMRIPSSTEPTRRGHSDNYEYTLIVGIIEEYTDDYVSVMDDPTKIAALSFLAVAFLGFLVMFVHILMKHDPDDDGPDFTRTDYSDTNENKFLDPVRRKEIILRKIVRKVS